MSMIEDSQKKQALKELVNPDLKGKRQLMEITETLEQTKRTLLIALEGIQAEGSNWYHEIEAGIHPTYKAEIEAKAEMLDNIADYLENISHEINGYEDIPNV